MTSDTNTTDGGSIEHDRLRRLEQLAMAATVAVILATFSLVGTAHGTEANPVMGALLDAAGWPAFALAKLVVTAGVFAATRRGLRATRHGTTAAALWGARTFALVMIPNAGHDLALLAEVWPVGLRWGTALGYAGAVALLAVVLVVRPDPRPVLEEIVSVSRDVTSRLSNPGMSNIRALILATLLILSAVGSPIALGPFPAADKAEAASEAGVYWNTEVGTYPNAVWKDDGYIYTVTQSGQLVKLDPDNGNEVANRSLSITPDRVYTDESSNKLFIVDTNDNLNSINYDGSSDWQTSASVNIQAVVANESDVFVDYYDSGTGDEGIKIYDRGSGTELESNLYSDSGVSEFGVIQPNNGYITANDGAYFKSYGKRAQVEWDFGDVGPSGGPVEQTFDGNHSWVTDGGQDSPVYEVDQSGTEVSQFSTSSTRNTVDMYADSEYVILSRNKGGFQVYDHSGNIVSNKSSPEILLPERFDNGGEMRLAARNGTSITAYNTGKSTGVSVDGRITGDNGKEVDGATVELRQSGSVAKSATSGTNGNYSFSAVQDGDYTIRASADGYQNASKSITVSGSPVTVDLSLFESGTFERTFQIDDPAQQTYPPTKSELSVYRWSTALEFPLPGGTTFRAGPGTWEHVATTQFNGFGQADVRLEDGTPYRAEVVATSGDRSTRWESLGWRADKDRDDPFVISLGSATDSSTPTATTAPTGTPTGTSTPTPTPEELGTPTATDGTGINGGGQAPTDPFDKDGDGDFFDDPAENDSTRSPTVAGANTGFGPRLAGSCLLADGTQGVLIEFWDPAYETSALTYNISHGDSSYAGERTFETPAGYSTWCVADAVTANASEQRTDLTGNYTQNGTTFNYSDSLSQSAVFGGPLDGGGGSSGEPSTGQRAVGIGLSAGVGYLLVRRFTEFRLSAALGTVVSRARSLVGGGGR